MERWRYKSPILREASRPLPHSSYYGVLADSAFPVSGDMSGGIVTPLKDGDMERAVARGRDERNIITLNNTVIFIGQAAE